MKSRRLRILFLIIAALVAGYFLIHIYRPADCVTPRTCYICHKTKGDPLGHDYTKASCTQDAICRRCGETGDPALGHDFLYLTQSFHVCQRCFEEEGQLTETDVSDCPVYFVYNRNNQRLLYEKDIYEQIAPASLTKLVTVQVALQYLDPNDLIEVGDELDLLMPNSSTAKLKKGQVLSVTQLLEACLIPSGNDAAYVLAFHSIHAAHPEITDTKEAVALFCEEMNAFVKELGYDSDFRCPDGYDQPEQYSSAAALLASAEKAMENPLIAKIVSLKEVWESLEDGTVFHWTNSNNMLWEESGPYSSIIDGVKTGFTGRAGRCVIICAEENGVSTLIGCFGCEDIGIRTDCVNRLLETVYGK